MRAKLIFPLKSGTQGKVRQEGRKNQAGCVATHPLSSAWEIGNRKIQV